MALVRIHDSIALIVLAYFPAYPCSVIALRGRPRRSPTPVT